MARTRVDYDDDDFDGYLRPQSQGSGNGWFNAKVVGAVIMVAFVGGMLVLFVSRGRRAEMAMDRAHAEAARIEAARDANMARKAPPSAFWSRIIGTWSRTPAEKEDGGHPYRLEFRRDRTAISVRLNSNGESIQHGSTVEVISEHNDTVRLLLKVERGAYSYTVTIKPDGTLSLDNVDGGLIFHRDK